MRTILITASDFKDFDTIMRANGGFRPFKTDMLFVFVFTCVLVLFSYSCFL